MSRVFVIAQGGGPTAVINQTLAGAVIEARRRHPGAAVLGARHGVRGIAAADFIDLGAIAEGDLRAIAATPVRRLLDPRQAGRRLLRTHSGRLRGAGADAFIYIGGNDTAGTLQLLDRQGDGRIAFIHAPKTIDNDLAENDHTPGFIRPRGSWPRPSSASISTSRPAGHLHRYRDGPSRRFPRRLGRCMAASRERGPASGLCARNSVLARQAACRCRRDGDAPRPLRCRHVGGGHHRNRRRAGRRPHPSWSPGA